MKCYSAGFKGLMFRVLLFIWFSGLPIFALDVPLFVEEPGAAARTNEGVSCGIPFPKGVLLSTSNLSLRGASGEVPAQFDILSRHGDGSIQWALASFVTDINRNQTLNFTASTTSPTVSPSRPVTISSSGSVLKIDNGVVRFNVDTASFTGIDSLYYKNIPVFGGKSGGIFLTNHLTGVTHSNSSEVKTKIVYTGALRVTLKVDGTFFTYDSGGVGFSYLITVYAGSPKIKIDISVKNSINPACGDVARIERCWLTFPVLFNPTLQTSYKFATDATLNPDVVNYAGAGFSMSVHEDWAGGWYMKGGTQANNFQYHKQGFSAGHLFVDVVTKPDSGLYGATNYVGYENGPWLWLPDGFHKNSHVFIDFADSELSQSQVTAKYTENKSLLMGRPSPDYVASTGLYSTHNHFGSVNDEKKMWIRMGGDTAGVALEAPTRNLNFMICLPGYAGVHDDFEEDPLEQYLMMWLRTGKRAYLDIGEGWAKYMKSNFTIHTDGFHYDGWRNVIQTLRNLSTRSYIKRIDDPNFTTGRNKIFHSTADVLVLAGGGSSYAGCHMAGQGLVDWYCLTGDPLALSAADDMAEIAWLHGWRGASGTVINPFQQFTWQPSMNNRVFVDVSRHFTRPFKVLAHYVSRLHPSPDSLWVQRLKYVASVYNRPINRDPRGFLFSMYDSTRNEFENWPTELTDYFSANKIQYQNRVRLQSLGYFEGNTVLNSAVGIFKKPANNGADTLKWLIKKDDTYWSTRMHAPLDGYVTLTGDEDARDLLIGYAQFCTYRSLMVDRCGFNHYTQYDFPDIDTSVNNAGRTNFSAEHDVCQTEWGTAPGSMPSHSSSYGIFFPEVMAIGYRHTGDVNMLKRGFEIWNKNIKRSRGSEGSYINDFYDVAKMTAKYGFLKAGDWVTLGDRVTGGLGLFRCIANRTDTLAPDAVTDLYISHDSLNRNRIRVSFTAPADLGGGAISEYQVKFDTVPIVEYHDFNYARDYIFPAKGIKKSPWWYARNVNGEVSPQVAGTRVEFALDDIAFSGTDTLFFAISSRDNSGNLSHMSNLLTLTSSMVSTENGFRSSTNVSLAASPNPFNPATIISVGFLKGTQPSIVIYDAMGRVVNNLTRQIKIDSGNKLQKILWNGRDSFNNVLSSGLYMAELRSGGVVKRIKLLLLK